MEAQGDRTVPGIVSKKQEKRTMLTTVKERKPISCRAEEKEEHR